jgi:hypothetical protein
MITDDIIKYLDKIYHIDISRPDYEYDLHDPIVGIVTPEWYYSDSYKIFNNQTINYKEIEKSDRINRIVKEINKPGSIPNTKGEFELDFYCWYQSYHFLPRTKWGIHITHHGWLNMASKLYGECPSLISKPLESAKSAFLYLYYHTLFHYIIENAASILEIILNQKDIYKKYFYDIYSQEFNSSKCIEESLANRYLIEKSDECNISKEYLMKILSNQANGYKQFINFLDNEFFKGNRILINRIKNSNSGDNYFNTLKMFPLEQLIDIFNPLSLNSNHQIPIWLHDKPNMIK